ncbi:hypothetical protein ABB37_06764 [Leptomonas pyrrhocoris]|uniref:Arrestin-like N-terminal domain-containing protein n=1 Tax=Leptomonas pyrrhocoris TaxID=157538 RepID=A0A0M9FXI6_LEPPY|nr:hypothetical protein ABB37_06764 [Leptomonas pyrrhocoris]KPA78003.1 hypothetical protein ABB37_06764 [Leptomonas pyrrhocoris]|eukprot:XP_015656442.1 hypothetical protein ABB37_06764 [Leptomonas pyrrhocoris]
MGFLEKSKVTLTILCEGDTVAPASTVTGALQVEVHHEVVFTALRIRLRGKEKFYVQRRDAQGHTYTEHRHFTHVEEVHTLLGAPVGSASSGSTQLAPGTYVYPFSVLVPSQAPPSFKRCRHEYGCTLAYKLKGLLDIPHGFDAEVEYDLTVTQAVPISQLQPARQNLKALPLSEAHIAKCRCCGSCFCCVDEESFIRTEAAIAPEIVLLHSHVQLPAVTAVSSSFNNADGADALVSAMPVSADATAALLRIRVTNFARDKALSRCKVTMAQRHSFPRDDWCTYKDTFTFFKQEVVFPAGPLGTGQTATVEVLLRLDEAHAGLPSGERLLPCLAVKHFSIFTELQITFPEVAAEGTMWESNALLLADEVDMTSQSLVIPHTYDQELRVAGEAPLV